MTSNLFPVYSGYFHLCDDGKYNNCFLSNCTDKNYGRNISLLAVNSNYLCKVKYSNPRLNVGQK